MHTYDFVLVVRLFRCIKVLDKDNILTRWLMYTMIMGSTVQWNMRIMWMRASAQLDNLAIGTFDLLDDNPSAQVLECRTDDLL